MILTPLDLNPNISWLSEDFKNMHSLNIESLERSNQELKIFNETKTDTIGIHKVPLLTQESAQNIVNILKALPIDWVPERNDLYGAPEVRILKVSEIFGVKLCHLILESVKPIIAMLSGGRNDISLESIRDVFFINYVAGLQEDIAAHYDEQARFSISLELTNTTTEMIFPVLDTEVEFSQGEALVFPGGSPVYLHKPTKTTIGERIVLVLWLN